MPQEISGSEFSVKIGNVWMLGANDECTPIFSRKVSIDPDERFTEHGDFMRAIHVRGLMPRDIFIFLDVREARSRTVDSIGYVITKNTTDYSIIVPGDLLKQRPDIWLDQKTTQKLRYIGTEALIEFSLDELANIVES